MDGTTQIYTLDMAADSKKESLRVKQHDTNSRWARISLMAFNEPWNIPFDCQIYINVKKTDGTVAMGTCTKIDGSTVMVPITGQMTSVSGFQLAELYFLTQDGDIKSQTFQIAVSSAVMDGDRIESSNEFSALITALKDVKISTDAADKATCDAADQTALASQATQRANTAAESLQASIDSAAEAKVSERLAIAAKVEVETLKIGIENTISIGTDQIKATLATAGKKEVDAIISAGGGIENALSNYFAIRRNRKIYTTRIYKYSKSTSPVGEKLNSNAGLVCVPSTNTVIGRDDYQNHENPLFWHCPCNFIVDASGFNHPTALDGMPGFKKTGKVDVGEVTMSGWIGIDDTPDYVDVHYSDSPNNAMGLRPMPESVNPDGTVSPFMIHGKYGAVNIDNVPYSSAGLPLANGSQKEAAPISYTGMIAYMHKKGAHYCGTTNYDLFYRQLMCIIKYGTTHSQSVFAGCSSYSVQYSALTPEQSVRRVIMTKSQAAQFFTGGYVSIGDAGANTGTDRQYAHMHNLAYSVKVTKIEPVDAANSAIYIDTATPFNTTLTTFITSMPWTTGSTDSVLGSDGSPYSNSDGKNCFKIQGIETGYGAYEVLGNTIMDIVADGTTPVRDVYVCKNANELTADIATVRLKYKKAAWQIPQTNAMWKYISGCAIDPVLGVMLPTETEAGSITGYADGLYTDVATSGQREWLVGGYLNYGALAGLWVLNAYLGWSYTYWSFVSGVSPNGTRGEWSGVA